MDYPIAGLRSRCTCCVTSRYLRRHQAIRMRRRVVSTTSSKTPLRHSRIVCLRYASWDSLRNGPAQWRWLLKYGTRCRPCLAVHVACEPTIADSSALKGVGRCVLRHALWNSISRPLLVLSGSQHRQQTLEQRTKVSSCLAHSSRSAFGVQDHPQQTPMTCVTDCCMSLLCSCCSTV